MTNPTTEWVVVRDNIAVIASEIGDLWFLELDERGAPSPFSKQMTCKGTVKSTAALINGAIALGFGLTQESATDDTVSLPQYVFNLVGTYHNAQRTPRNYRRAANRLRELGRQDISSYLETHALEETGHERLILKDLNALGLPADRLVSNLMPRGVKLLVDFFDQLSSASYPLGSLGYSYCFEYTAAMKPRSQVEAMQAQCPHGVDATRFLRTHSCLGSEVEHVEDLVCLIAGLPAPDRIEVIKAAYDTAAMTAILRRDVRETDEAIMAQLEAAAGQKLNLAA
jgi:hypothetical protein